MVRILHEIRLSNLHLEVTVFRMHTFFLIAITQNTQVAPGVITEISPPPAPPSSLCISRKMTVQYTRW